ncbi:hypothetical protein HYQ46_010954 [Verticillium longisporum]|nr:hypothetical protein HYQ46_010954 [Verticillium longisporum]
MLHWHVVELSSVLGSIEAVLDLGKVAVVPEIVALLVQHLAPCLLVCRVDVPVWMVVDRAWRVGAPRPVGELYVCSGGGGPGGEDRRG